jgi:hypothetical protein
VCAGSKELAFLALNRRRASPAAGPPQRADGRTPFIWVIFQRILPRFLARASRTQDDGSAGYFLVELGKLCGFHTWPSHRRRTDHHVPGSGKRLKVQT